MDSSSTAPTRERLRTFCTVPGCLEPAEGFVGNVYAHPTRWHLCAMHMRPIRRELLALLRDPRSTAEPAEADAKPPPSSSGFYDG
jgi:hypothetical protein